MRTIIIKCIFAFLFFTVSAKAQTPALPIDEETKLIAYTKVVEIAGVSKADLYSRALAWANKYYKNPAEVIREKDAAAGKMVCKARFKLMGEPDKKGFQSDDGNVQYTLTIEAKEGKYRYKLSEINHKQQSYFAAERWMDTKNQYYTKEWDFYLKETDEAAKGIVANLEKDMQQTPKVKKDDW